MSDIPRPRLARQPRAGALPVFAVVLALLVAAPVLAILLTAFGWGAQGLRADTLSHLFATVLPRYALTTALLAAITLCVAITCGVTSAWLVASQEFPGRRFLAPALVLPLAMPAFVMAYAYTDFLQVSGPLQSALREVTGWRVREYWFPEVRSTWGAGLFLGLALYPYVYLLARTAFAERSASLEEAARSLGLPQRWLWWRVAWPVARPAVAAGSVLVLMETVADFGVVSFFAVDSFSAGIYRAWLAFDDRITAARLALALLVVVGALAWLERRQRRRMRFSGRGARRAPRVRVVGWRAWRATLLCAAPVVLGFVAPAMILIEGWFAEGAMVDPRIVDWMFNTTRLALLGAAFTVPAGLLVAYAVRSAPGAITRTSVTVANGGYALPGVVLGIGLLLVVGAFDRNVWQPIMGGTLLAGTVVAVVYAYGVRFFAVAYQGIDAGLARIGPAMDDTARSLGLTPGGVLARVHWPMLRRSLAVAALLVALDCLKELPATLVLRPFDTDTLAVVAYQFASDERLAQAALPSLAIVAIGILPALLLGRAALRD